MNDERDVSRKSKEVDLESGDVLQDEVTVIGNSKVISNALEELNRVDLSELGPGQTEAYADSVQGLVYLDSTMEDSEGDNERAARKIKELSDEVSKLESRVAEGLSDELQKQNIGGGSDD